MTTSVLVPLHRSSADATVHIQFFTSVDIKPLYIYISSWALAHCVLCKRQLETKLEAPGIVKQGLLYLHKPPHMAHCMKSTPLNNDLYS